MKKIILSTLLLVSSISAHANNFNMPWNNNNGFNNGSNWNMPNMNWGNGSGYNSSNWNMPNMNFGSSNNGSNWNMPNMNWGNGNNNYRSGSNMSMPNMNWGNGSGYGSGSNWNMPNMNWGNGYGNGSNWNMPGMNWNNNNTPWNSGNNRGYAPNVQYRAPAMPATPRFMTPLPKAQTKPAPQIAKPVVEATNKPAVPTQIKIPSPDEVKGVILAPDNKPEAVEATEK